MAWTVFADAFCVEATEVKLNCRRFSVASFLSCLNHNSEVASCIVDMRPETGTCASLPPITGMEVVRVDVPPDLT